MQVSNKSNRIPAVILRAIDATRIAVRFQHLGTAIASMPSSSDFAPIFLLATCEVLEGQPWWIIASSQHEELIAFCHRNGLVLFDKGSKG